MNTHAKSAGPLRPALFFVGHAGSVVDFENAVVFHLAHLALGASLQFLSFAFHLLAQVAAQTADRVARPAFHLLAEAPALLLGAVTIPVVRHRPPLPRWMTAKGQRVCLGGLRAKGSRSKGQGETP